MHLLLFAWVGSVYAFDADGGNADVNRYRNQAYLGLPSGNADVSRYRNQMSVALPFGNADVDRYRNQIYFGLPFGNADLGRYRNQMYLNLPFGNADVNRYRNLALMALPETADVNSIEQSREESTFCADITVKIADSNDIPLNGDLQGTLKFTNFETITISSGSFSGKGFSKGEWQATVEGADYEGKWSGVVFLRSSEGRIYLEGATSGDIVGTIEGYLTESTPQSGVYNHYQATWKIGKVLGSVTSAIINLDGVLNYQSTSQVPIAGFRLLQSSFAGKILRQYNCSLSTVLTQVRVVNGTDYNGQGFSIVSYTSDFGAGEGWTYDQSSTDIVQMVGISTGPLFGVLSATVYESTLPRILGVIIQRIDLGSIPAADLKVTLWGPERVSPGQTVTYIVEYRNDGEKKANLVAIGVEIPQILEYVTSSNDGFYFYPESPGQELWFENDVKPHSTGYETITIKIPFGLQQGTKLSFSAFIGPSIPEIRDGFNRSTDEIVLGNQAPNIGDDGWEGKPEMTFTETRVRIRNWPLAPIKQENADGTCTITFRVREWIDHQERKCHMVYNPIVGQWVSKVYEDWRILKSDTTLREKTLITKCDQGCLPTSETPGSEKAQYVSQIATARDPNAKSGPEGYVLSGQKLNYTVEFENKGEGIAYGVYFTDVLAPSIDEATLQIGPVHSTTDGSIIASAGTYNPSTRTITWFVGEVGSTKGGYATFSVFPKNNVPKYTEIINYATVYFPSVPEITRTNAIVSIIGEPNIAVTTVTSSESTLSKNTNHTIVVSALNKGYYSESFNLILYANSTVIQTQNVTLLGRNNCTVSFMWNTTNFADGNYRIAATASSVQGELNTADNTYSNLLLKLGPDEPPPSPTPTPTPTPTTTPTTQTQTTTSTSTTPSQTTKSTPTPTQASTPIPSQTQTQTTSPTSTMGPLPLPLDFTTLVLLAVILIAIISVAVVRRRQRRRHVR